MISDVTLHPVTTANEITLTPVVEIAPCGEFFTPEKPAIIELLKTVKLSDQNKTRKFILMNNYSNLSSSMKWNEMSASIDREMEDRIMFKTTHFCLFVAIVRFPFPSASARIEKDTNSQLPAELIIPEMPGFKVHIPQTSVLSDTNITATIHSDDRNLCQQNDNNSLASACIGLEPHGLRFTQKISITFPVPNYAKITKEHPDAQLQCWHAAVSADIGGSEPTNLKWELIDDADISVSQVNNSQYAATIHTSHFSFFKLIWKAEKLVLAKHHVKNFCSKLLVRNRVESISGRCQVFMSQETKTSMAINFSIAVLIYPFQEPYASLENYHYILYDSGEKPIEFTVGNLTCAIKLKDELFLKKSLAERQRSYKESVTLSENFMVRPEFDIELDLSAKLTEGMVLAKLIINHGDVQQHKCNLIKVCGYSVLQ